MKYSYIFIISLLFAVVSFAQTGKFKGQVDSIQSVELNAVTVVGEKPDKYKFHRVELLDIKNSGTVNAIDQVSSIYLNQQGPGILATTSIHGLNASAVPILWKNWTINSAMNGLFDLSLMNGYLFNQTSIIFSESLQNAGWSGAGGVIRFEQKQEALNQLQYQYGSFNKYQVGGTYNLSKQINSKNFSRQQQIDNQIKLVYQNAENDFLFNLPGNDSLRQVNSNLKEFGFVNSTKILLTQEKTFEVDIWWQKTHREIPPPLNIRNTGSYQIDSALRVSLNFLHPQKKLEIGLAYFNELNHYIDPFYSINGKHQIETAKLYVNHNREIIENLGYKVSFSYNLYKAVSSDLSETRWRNNAILKTLVEYSFEQLPLSIKADLVLDFTDNKLQPFRPGLYCLYNPSKKISLRGQVSRHYRLPTFNDLYWQPGGNPDLKPEHGFLQEISATYLDKNIKVGIALFNNNINNEITWIPNGSLWQPQNVDKVNSKGFDINVNKQFLIYKEVVFSLNAAYSLVDARKIESKANTGATINKQLIYKPKHKFTSTISLDYKNFDFQYIHKLIGKRFTTTNHSNFLEAYQSGDFSFRYLVPIDKIILDVEAAILNIWNANYQVIENRPMPGTNFLLTTNFKF